VLKRNEQLGKGWLRAALRCDSMFFRSSLLLVPSLFRSFNILIFISLFLLLFEVILDAPSTALDQTLWIPPRTLSLPFFKRDGGLDVTEGSE